MKTRQENVVTNTKTKDNVTVQVTTAIMYKVGTEDEDIKSYFFKLSEPKRQIEGYVDDCIRSQVRPVLQCLPLVYLQLKDTSSVCEEGILPRVPLAAASRS